MVFKDPEKRAAHMEKMRAGRRARAAADAVAADNPIEGGQSIEDMDITIPVQAKAEQTTARPRGRPKKSAVPPPPPPPANEAFGMRRRADTPEIPPSRGEPRRQLRTDPTVRREPMRDPATGRVVVTRNGKVFTRRHTNVGDKFHMDPADNPEGMSYQWIAVTIMGAEQRNTVAAFNQNGWEPVDISRYPGRYGPDNATGPILIDGLMLCERPIELTEEARGEEIAAARTLIRTRNDQFIPRLPDARSKRGTELRAKRTIEGMPTDVGRPAYQMDVDDGLL